MVIYACLKRIMDIVIASLTLLVFAPFYLLIAALIKIDSPGPVLFWQQRLGKSGKPFTMYKFRTMQHNVPMIRNVDGSLFVGAQDPRLTRVGRLLRAYSLDEIPQAFNVLKGDMSMVGPRPDLVEDLARYDGTMHRKLEVKPGLASLPAVHGRNLLPWRKRVELDVYYIDHRSLRLDLAILFKSVIHVLLCRGIYTPENYQDVNHPSQEERRSG